MKSCSRIEKGENCCRWGHIEKNVSCIGLTEGATTGRDSQYHKAVGVDVEVVGLTVRSVGVESRDIILIYIHVETMLCKYRSNIRCNVEH